MSIHGLLLNNDFVTIYSWWLLWIKNSSRSHLFQEEVASLGELSVDAICRHLNKLTENLEYKIPRNTKCPRECGHVGWSEWNSTFRPIHGGRGPSRVCSISIRDCSRCIECGWCKLEALLKDQDLPKAGKSACSLKQFVSEYFVVNKRFYKWPSTK